MVTQDPHEPSPLDDPSVRLSSNRTAMSLERTRFSIDRTLMSVVRTSLSLISFGFTIYQVFNKLVQERHPGATRNFGATLIILGILLLILGLVAHVVQFRDLRRRRNELHDMGLLTHGPLYRSSPTALIALLLLALGLMSILDMLLKEGPFN